MGTAFGIGSPGTYPVQPTPWGFVPLGGPGSQGFVTHPFVHPLQHALQSLQIVPYQLQQLQQLVQLIPAQLYQLQQLIQFVPQQIQQLQQTQQFGHYGLPGVPTSPPIAGAFAPPYVPASAFSVPFTGQQVHVM